MAVTTTLVRLTRQIQRYSDRTRQYRVLLDDHEAARLKWAQTLELAVECQWPSSGPRWWPTKVLTLAWWS